MLTRTLYVLDLQLNRTLLGRSSLLNLIGFDDLGAELGAGFETLANWPLKGKDRTYTQALHRSPPPLRCSICHTYLSNFVFVNKF